MNNSQKFTVSPAKKGETHSMYAYRNIRKNIMNLNLLPGEIINEAELANIMSISRTPVHEAVLGLRDNKLIDVIPRRESRVSFINLEYVNEGIFIRCSLEPVLLSVLAGTISGKSLLQLQKNLDEQYELFNDKQNLGEFYELDDEFHHILYEAANKPNVYRSVRDNCAHLDRIRYMVRLENDVDIEEASLSEHKQILRYLTIGLDENVNYNEFFKRHIMRFQEKLPLYLEHYEKYFTFVDKDKRRER